MIAANKIQDSQTLRSQAAAGGGGGPPSTRRSASTPLVSFGGLDTSDTLASPEAPREAIDHDIIKSLLQRSARVSQT